MERARQLLDEGARHGQNGAWSQAVHCFESAVQLCPDLAEAHHNFSIAATHLQDFAAAYEAALSATSLDRSAMAYVLNLGNLAIHQGKQDIAEDAFEDAVKLAPDNPAPHGNLGLLKLHDQDWDGAQHHLEVAANGKHGNKALLVPLASAFRHGGNPDRAIEVIDQYMALDSANVNAQIERIRILNTLGRFEEAIEAAQNTLKTHGESSDVSCLLAQAKHSTQDSDSAIAILQPLFDRQPGEYQVAYLLADIVADRDGLTAAQSVMERYCLAAPDDHKGYWNIGYLSLQFADYAQAIEMTEKALSMAPGNPDALYTLGRTYLEMRDYAQAKTYFNQSIANGVTEGNCFISLSQAHFATGELGPGWDANTDLRAAEARLGLSWIDPQRDRPETPIAGKRILIRREQGIGDEIRWSSCYDEAIAEASSCIIQCDRRLEKLFARAFPTAELYPVEPLECPTDVPGPETYDIACLAGDLPNRYRRSIDAFPRKQVLLTPDPESEEKWRRRLDDLGPGLKVGICWRSDTVTWHRMRNKFYSHIDEWGDILTLPNTHFINLFYGECEYELENVHNTMGVAVHRWPDLDLRNDVDSILALISQLDLVITSQTAVWDMSGAVGTEAWAVLNPVHKMGADYVPWYQSVHAIPYDVGESSQAILARIAQQLEARLPH